MSKTRSAFMLADRITAIAKPTTGFDYMRLALAVIVLIWHSFLVTHGLNWAEAVMFSPVGVVVRVALPMFFALSGFLVAGSLERNASIPTFVLFRALRIIPALAVEITLSALLIGAFTTTLTIGDYYRNPGLGAYFFNIIGWIHFNLPGVFAGNPDDTVNRSLWTIPSELECYLFLVVVAVGRLYTGRIRLFTVVSAVYFGYVLFRLWRDGGTPGFQPHGGTVLSRLLIFYFMAGVLVFRWRHSIPYRADLFAVSAVCAVATLLFEPVVWLSSPAVAYATVYLGMLNPPRAPLLLSGDYSYGVYLYAYPIQQTYVHLLPGGGWSTNLMLALPTTFLFAVISWHLIEKPALRAKRLFARPRAPARVEALLPDSTLPAG